MDCISIFAHQSSPELTGLKRFLMFRIEFRDVQSVYSGKPGCCCGCRGKHTYASATQLESGKRRGYPVTKDEVNDRVVRQTIEKISKLALLPSTEVTVTPILVSAQISGRLYIAYFVGRAR